MKNKFIKYIASLLAVSLFLCTLAGCNGKQSDEYESITKSTEEIEPPVSQELVDFDDYNISENTSDSENESTSTTKPSGNSGDEVTTTTRPASSPNNGNGNGSGGSTSSGVTKADMVKLLTAAGYVYDPEQDIYYTTLNPWQRNFGFTNEYDIGASYLNMEYVTFRCNFQYAGKYWRIQCWKGQYALLSGAEMGVYTRDPSSDQYNDFYVCAEDDELLEMGFDFYKTTRDYNNKNKLFSRPLEYHWWQTGFKFGYCNPTNCVAVMTLYAKDTEMADGIEKGLRSVTDKNGKPNPFYRYGTAPAQGQSNIYKRTGNEFKIIWLDAGYTNYSGSMI